MIERQYCASAYTIDFENKKVLLMYNKKLNKWLQPGGHIEGKETPEETAKRETFEETGIEIKIIGPTFDNRKYHPIAIERYINKVGDMIDIQFVAIPITKKLLNDENNKTMWFSIENLETQEDIEDDIKNKVKALFEKYK
ncbi:MAG: NUDIX domain-containing protein [Clostridia bacterium]|nr:NUDIX domain-containing protein [Clostridia bacterium]